MLENFVFEENGELINTINKKFLPINSPKESLIKNNFLEGQRKDAVIESFLLDSEVLWLNINPTWECNLRCKHCSVINNLKIKDEDELNVNNVLNFVEKIVSFRGNVKTISISFVGGEALLRCKKCFEINLAIKKNFCNRGIELKSGITTNLSIELNEMHLDFLNSLEIICVSLDGDEEYYNNQRISLIKEKNLYEKTINNLQMLVEYGFAEKLRIQSALSYEHLKDVEKYKKFLQKIGYMGIDLDKVTYGAIHPTDRINESKYNFTSVKNKLKSGGIYSKPCCKYRIKSFFAIDPNGDVYDVYYTYARQKICNINKDYDIEQILEYRKKNLEDFFPCFKDEKCMKCPVLGFCWGFCVNTSTMTKDNPSDFCNQETLIKRIGLLNKNKELKNFILQNKY